MTEHVQQRVRGEREGCHDALVPRQSVELGLRLEVPPLAAQLGTLEPNPQPLARGHAAVGLELNRARRWGGVEGRRHAHGGTPHGPQWPRGHRGGHRRRRRLLPRAVHPWRHRGVVSVADHPDREEALKLQ